MARSACPLALVFLLALPVFSGAQPWIYGFTMPSWNSDAYGGDAAARSLDGMAATGAKWVAVIPTWYQSRGRDSTMRRTYQTATDDSVRKFIREAKAHGLRVMLKPHVNTLDGKPVRPRDAGAWFRAYDPVILNYARLAQSEGVEILVIGTELTYVAGPNHRAQWADLIRRVRAVYSGKLTFAAHAYDFGEVDFWGLLDFVGVDGYFPMLGGHSERAMVFQWKALYRPVLELACRAYGKPLLFTEIGISSQKGANRKPWAWNDFGAADPRTQADYFQAFIDAFKDEPYFAGFLQWCWSLDANDGGPADKSMTVQGKPALKVLEAYFKELDSPQARSRKSARAARRLLPLLRSIGSAPVL